MPENFNNLTSKTSIYNVLEALKDNINYNINCIKIAKVIEFFPNNLTVSCQVMNKQMLGINQTGNQILQDYPIIYANVHFFGWGDIGATYPIEEGMEGILLFNDREKETWFTTGETGNLAYNRCHNLSDAIFICGIHSLPNMIEFINECLNIYHDQSYIRLYDKKLDIKTIDEIKTETKATKITSETNTIKATATPTETKPYPNAIEGNTKITGTLTVSSTANANVLKDDTAATDSFTSADGKTITVVNGIVRTITTTPT